MSSPLVSVIIPTYNRGDVLFRALKSVVSQQYHNWEIIVVDNESTDDTLEIINNYNDKRIRLLTIKNNGVIAASRNLGIHAAKGDLIAFLDSDDWWTEDKLSSSIQIIQKGYDVVFHPLWMATKAHQRYFLKSPLRKLSSDISMDLILNGSNIANSSILIRKSYIKNVGGLREDKDIIGWEDFDLLIRVAKAGAKFKGFAKPCGYYWIGGGNYSNPDRIIRNIWTFIERYQGIKVGSGWVWYALGIQYRNKRDHHSANAYYKKVLGSKAKPSLKFKSVFRRILYI